MQQATFSLRVNYIIIGGDGHASPALLAGLSLAFSDALQEEILPQQRMLPRPEERMPYPQGRHAHHQEGHQDLREESSRCKLCATYTTYSHTD